MSDGLNIKFPLNKLQGIIYFCVPLPPIPLFHSSYIPESFFILSKSTYLLHFFFLAPGFLTSKSASNDICDANEGDHHEAKGDDGDDGHGK